MKIINGNLAKWVLISLLVVTNIYNFFQAKIISEKDISQLQQNYTRMERKMEENYKAMERKIDWLTEKVVELAQRD